MSSRVVALITTRYAVTTAEELPMSVKPKRFDLAARTINIVEPGRIVYLTPGPNNEFRKE